MGTYIAIDLKSFFASVECVKRNLDPLNTNLVVADKERTSKTICLAVSPSLKEYRISGRARLFEVEKKVKEINQERKGKLNGKVFEGKSFHKTELEQHPEYELDYIVATPRMNDYMEYSSRIYSIYLKYVAPEDIHIYSIDEVFIDVTHYLATYKMTARELTEQMIRDVLQATNITATAGIGNNLYLCKVAMDIVAKSMEPDANGARIAELDEISYRKLLWNHKPLHDFWRVGRGYEKKLHQIGLYTMGDIARCSIGKEQDYYNEDLLYKLFGINAELLIDHAWGWEPTTMEMIKAYRPNIQSISRGQVLHVPYNFEDGRIVIREMAEVIALELVDKKLISDQMVLTVGYDIENLASGNSSEIYDGEIQKDYYGRNIPKHAHGTANLKKKTSSTRMIVDAVLELYDQIVNPKLTIRRFNLTANRLVQEGYKQEETYEQLSLFTDYDSEQKKQKEEEKERKLQEAMLSIKKRYGKNAMLKGMNLQEKATGMDRNNQIGGHKA